MGEDGKGQIDTKSAIDRAIKRSAKLGGDEDWGPGAKIAKDRPESILGNASFTGNAAGRFGDLLANAFCPTGEGGGVDPSCSPGSVPSPADRVAALHGGGYKTASWDDVDGAVKAMKSMSVAEVKALAAKLGVRAGGKSDVIKRIKADLDEFKGSFERTDFR